MKNVQILRNVLPVYSEVLVHLKNIESLEISYFLHTIFLDDPLKPLDLYNDFTNLQIFMIHFQYICDVEWTMFSTTCLL